MLLSKPFPAHTGDFLAVILNFIHVVTFFNFFDDDVINGVFREDILRFNAEWTVTFRYDDDLVLLQKLVNESLTFRHGSFRLNEDEVF